MTENATTLVDVSPPRSGEPPEELAAWTPAEQETVRVRLSAPKGVPPPRPVRVWSGRYRGDDMSVRSGGCSRAARRDIELQSPRPAAGRSCSIFAHR